MEESDILLEPLSIRLDVKRAVPPLQRDLLAYDIRGNADTVKVSNAKISFNFLTNLWI